MLNAGTLTYDKYNQTKREHELEMAEKLRRNEVQSYDYKASIFFKLDEAIAAREMKHACLPAEKKDTKKKESTSTRPLEVFSSQAQPTRPLEVFSPDTEPAMA